MNNKQDALAIVKQMVADGQVAQDVAEKYFPELAESEDERTRKEIIDFATKVSNGFTSILANNYDFNKWIAYLEKQGKKKPNKCMYSNDNYTDEDRKVLCDGCKEDCELKHKQWKPSKEQLRELHCAISGCSFDTPELVELEEQLKAL